MGLRHARHRFMPNVLVFPGGRVDRADHDAPAVSELPRLHPRLPGAPAPRRRWRARSASRPRASCSRRPGWSWAGWTGTALLPDLGALDYLCRAVTPRGDADPLQRALPDRAGGGRAKAAARLRRAGGAAVLQLGRGLRGTSSPSSPRRSWRSSATGWRWRRPSARCASWSASAAWTTACRKTERAPRSAPGSRTPACGGPGTRTRRTPSCRCRSARRGTRWLVSRATAMMRGEARAVAEGERRAAPLRARSPGRGPPARARSAARRRARPAAP